MIAGGAPLSEAKARVHARLLADAGDGALADRMAALVDEEVPLPPCAGAWWPACCLAVRWRHRPAPGRIRALRPAAQSPAGHASARRAAGALTATAALERLGAGVLRRQGRPGGPEASRRLGTALAVGACALAVLPPAALPAGLVVWALPGLNARRQRRRHVAAIAADLPDVVDLLVLAVGAGLTVRLAVVAVARRSPGPLGAEPGRALEEAELGRRLADALDDLPERAGDATRPLVARSLPRSATAPRWAPAWSAWPTRYGPTPGGEPRSRPARSPSNCSSLSSAAHFPPSGSSPVAPLIASAVRSLRL